MKLIIQNEIKTCIGCGKVRKLYNNSKYCQKCLNNKKDYNIVKK